VIKQAIWVLALIGRHLCEAVLECYETRPDLDEPLPDDVLETDFPEDCGLLWNGRTADDQPLWANLQGADL
jgi:hypothetical protein